MESKVETIYKIATPDGECIQVSRTDNIIDEEGIRIELNSVEGDIVIYGLDTVQLVVNSITKLLNEAHFEKITLSDTQKHKIQSCSDVSLEDVYLGSLEKDQEEEGGEPDGK